MGESDHPFDDDRGPAFAADDQRDKSDPEGGTVPPAETLSGPGQAYLATLIGNIEIMLDYANRMGKPVPDELRRKLALLLASPAVTSADKPAGRRRLGWLSASRKG